MLYTKLCVSLKKDTNKQIDNKEKNNRFEDNFDSKYYMENKEKIDKVTEVAELIEKSLKTIITYDEFNRLKSLLNELKIISDDEFNEKLVKLNFKNIDDIFNAIKKYRTEEPVIRHKINDFLGTLSGATTTTQINIIREYKRSKKK